MKPHLFRAAVTAAAILLPLQAEAESAARHLRADRGRLELVELDQVPGKSVPRYIRVCPTGDEGAR